MAATWKSNIAKIKTLSREELRKLIGTATLKIEAEARMGAPEDTGFLRSSIANSFPDDLTGVVSVGAEYGIYVEMGTTRTPAQPFLLPAAERVMKELGGELKQVI
jgi:HK97 gp10 family phage protein